jgi:hypothetical protein
MTPSSPEPFSECETALPTAMGGILANVCRPLHARSSDVRLVVEDTGGPLHVAHGAIAHRILDELLSGLVDASRCLDAGGLGLVIRTGKTSSSVCVSIEIQPDRNSEAYRTHVLGQLVKQRDDPLLDHELDRASVAIRNAEGNLLCREGDGGRLFVQVSLPAK